MKEDYEKINQMLDDAINNVLIETTDRFNIPDGDPFKEPVCDPSQTEMRFESYDPDDMKHIKKRQFEMRPHFKSGDDPPPNVRYSYDTKDDDDDYMVRPFESNQSKDGRVYERPTIHNRDKYTNRNDVDSFEYHKGSANNDSVKENKSYPGYERNQRNTQPEPHVRVNNDLRYKTRDENTNHIYESSTGPEEFPVSDEEPIPPRPKKSYVNPRETRSMYGDPERDQTTRRPKVTEAKAETYEDNDSEAVTAEKIVKLRNALPLVVPRSEWGALPPMKDLKRMEAPAESFVFSLNTNTPECHEPKECIRRVKEIQARHMGEGLGDIQYNFLVGGDGNMYEGRGWLYESGLPREVGEGVNYNIAFIGNHEDTSRIPPDMLGPVQDIVVHAKLNKLVVGNKVVKEIKPPKKE